jgi:two-component system response regulator MprA
VSKRNGNQIVLVVDDDDGIRALIEEMLARAGFHAESVADGESALAARATVNPDAVVLDVQLPGISGYEACRALKEADPELGILFLSGTRTEPMDRVAGLLVGADDYLAKPFAPDELVARVRALTRRRGSNGHAVASPLTKRELDVLRLLAVGRRKVEIAAELVITPSTVATHLEHIFGKLRVRNGAHAVSEAHRLELI